MRWGGDTQGRKKRRSVSEWWSPSFIQAPSSLSNSKILLGIECLLGATESRPAFASAKVFIAGKASLSLAHYQKLTKDY